MIVYDTVQIKGPNIYVGSISYTYKTLLIFLLTEDKLCAEKNPIYLDFCEIPCSQLMNQVFSYKTSDNYPKRAT